MPRSEPENEISPKRSVAGSEIQTSPSARRGSSWNRRRSRAGAGRLLRGPLVRHAGDRQLRDQLLDPPQHVGLLVPEVVQVRVERRLYEPQLVVVDVNRVLQNGPLG